MLNVDTDPEVSSEEEVMEVMEVIEVSDGEESASPHSYLSVPVLAGSDSSSPKLRSLPPILQSVVEASPAVSTPAPSPAPVIRANKQPPRFPVKKGVTGQSSHFQSGHSINKAVLIISALAMGVYSPQKSFPDANP